MSLRKLDSHFFIAISIVLCLFFCLFLPSGTKLKGVIVETHPLYWLSLILAFFFTFRIRKSHHLLPLVIVFSIGLSLRLIVPTHTLYPGTDPWLELASVNRIQAYGFDLRGNYYHGYEPILQMLLLATAPISGEYNTIKFFGPIFGWALGFICLYKLCKVFFDREATLYVLSFYSTTSLLLQSFTIPEQIAVPIGIAVVYFFCLSHVRKSRKDLLMLFLTFSVLTITHNLTSFSVLVMLSAWVLVCKSKNRSYSRILLIALILIFVLYWQHYQEFVSRIFLERTLPSIGEIPEPWPKPLWWWVCYLTPRLLLASLLARLAVAAFLHKEMRSEVPIICTTGCLLIVAGLIFPRGLYPWRILNQFGSYFAMGVLWLPKVRAIPKLRISTLVKILIAVNLIGLLADFPITNMNEYYVGGYWLDRSEAEVSALRYLGAYAKSRSYVVIDERCGFLLEALTIPGKKLSLVSNLMAYELYNTTTAEEAWYNSIEHGYDYIFISKFYEVIAHFDEISGARKFSDEQLMKFTPPHFKKVYETSEIWIYKVNTELPSDTRG